MLDPLIRLASLRDVPALARVAEDTFTETFVGGFEVGYPPEDLEYFLNKAYRGGAVERWISDPTAQVLVAEHEGRLIGYAHAGDNSLPVSRAKPGDGELKRIYVSRSAQGLGLGQALFERSLAWLGSRPVFIGVWSQNHKAIRLYSHYGFKEVGRYHFPVGKTLDQEVILGRGQETSSA